MSGDQTSNDSIETIIGGAAADESANGKVISQDDMRAMADSLQLLIADFGVWESYKAASTEYIQEFTTEVRWHRRIRLAVAIACGLLVIFMVSMLVIGVHSANSFKSEQSHALTALIVGCISGPVIVTIALIKGAYANLADRNAGLPMPEHMKEIVDAAKGLLDGAGKS